MRPVRAPLLLPACCLLAGTVLAPHISGWEVPGTVAVILALPWVAGGRGRGAAVWLALGLLNATWQWAGPAREWRALVPGRPVTVIGEAGAWTPVERGWITTLRPESLAQQAHRLRGGPPVSLFLPGAAPPPPSGCRLRLRGYLRPPRMYYNAPEITVGSWTVGLSSRRLLEELEEPRPWWRLAGLLRRRLQEAPRGDLGVALARALLLGEALALPPEWRAGLTRLGLGHLLAVSGLHLGLVAGLPWLLLPARYRRSRLAASLAATALYALLVGPRSSLLRAAVMAGVMALALLSRRPPLAGNALAGAVLVLVLLDPGRVFEPGFQLSLAATAGILWLGPHLRLAVAGLPGVLAFPLAATTAAQLATLPWGLALFHRVSPLAPLWNLVAIPWTWLSLAVSSLWGGLTLLSPGAGGWLVPVLRVLAAPYGWPAQLPPGGWWSQPVVMAWGWGVLAGAGGVLAAWRAPRVALALPALAPAVALLFVGSPPASGWVELAVIDVGQGDALLLRGGGRAVLVDGGGWRRAGFGGRVLVPALTALGVSRLDAVIASHPDRDHCGGLVDLAAEVAVGEGWLASGFESTACGTGLRERGVPLRVRSAGEELRVGAWSFTVLGPVAGGGSTNARSLVLMAEAADRRALLTGDIDRRVEDGLVRAWGAELVCDLLKVPHHGSATSTGWRLLAAARPRLALLSVGRRNSYGHPSPEVLHRLAHGGVPLLRTDRHGMIRVRWRRGSRLQLDYLGPGHR